MAYSTDHLRTAGKITVYTSLVGVLAFAVIFIFNLGATEIHQADAQSSNATTSVTVLNTPPDWTVDAEEYIGSSTSTPTNEGDVISWTAIGTDANSEDYYLLICEGSAAPSATSDGAPTCNGGVQWAVSTATVSGTYATAATTTTASTSPFAGEKFEWYAWICDGNSGTPRCNATTTRGSGTTSAPFHVNHRPSFTMMVDDSPADPGQLVTFTSTSDDPDEVGGDDRVRLIVCATAGFDTDTDSCTGTLLGSTTASGAALSNATATYTIVIPTQDQDYGAFGYIIDEHGFESIDAWQGSSSVLTVNNVAPTTSPSTITINGGSDMTLSVEQGETTGFTLSFTTADNNSCDSVATPDVGDEIVDFELSLYRSGVSSTTCLVDSAGAYDPNDCYTSAVATTTWDLSCTAATSTCSGTNDTTMDWNCTFPLWYIADPTDGVQGSSTEYGTENWVAQVRAIDDDGATSSLSESDSGVEVESFLAFALSTLEIPYGSLEPGNQTDPLNATTTILATGNVGLDKIASGTAMCTTYSGSTPCPNSSTSTIPAEEQRFATGTVSFASATALSSTTGQEIEINVPKSRATSTATSSDAYWGIRVPGSITFAGDYTGQNVFYAIVGESSFW